MFKIAILCWGGAAAFYLSAYEIKRKAGFLKSATRVNDLRGLSELLDNKTTPLLVAISGRVGSNTPLKSQHCDDVLCVFLLEKAKLVYETRNIYGKLMRSSAELLVKPKEVPWFLEDNTGRVHVVGAQYAKGFFDKLREITFDKPPNELINKLPKPAEILEHTCFERVLEFGKPLTIVGEAVKYCDGTLLIKIPMDGPFMVFDGYTSVDKMISFLESRSRTLLFIAIGLTAASALAYVSYLMPSIKKAWFRDNKSANNTTGHRAKLGDQTEREGKDESK